MYELRFINNSSNWTTQFEKGSIQLAVVIFKSVMINKYYFHKVFRHNEVKVSSITSLKAGKLVKRWKLGKQAEAGLIVQLIYKNPTRKRYNEKWVDTNWLCWCSNIELRSFILNSYGIIIQENKASLLIETLLISALSATCI